MPICRIFQTSPVFLRPLPNPRPVSPRSWRAGLGRTCLVLSLCALVAGCGGKPDPGVEIRTNRADTTTPEAGREQRLAVAAAALYEKGRTSSDPEPLRLSVRLLRELLALQNRATVPLDWAMTQNNLGTALATLGEREEGTAQLIEAVAAYRAALEVRTRETVPFDWATTQNNLGNALQTLGAREAGTARLEEAVAAYRAALEVWTRDALPYQHGLTRENMAILEKAWFEKTGERAALDRAEAEVQAAIDVYKAVGAGYNLGTAETLLTRILALRPAP